MNLLQEKVATLKQRGDINRSRWNAADMPILSGWPLRSYRWWQQETGYRGSENLCHFVRVALFWAPLRKITRPLRRLKDSQFIYLLIAALVLLVAWIELVVYTHTGVGGLLVRNGIIVGIALAVWALVKLRKLYERQISDALDWFIEASPNRLPWLRPWFIVPAALICLAPFVPGVLTLLILVGYLALIFGIVTGLSWLSNYIRISRQRREENAQKEVFLRALFAQLYPSKVDDQQAYAAWRERYIQWRLAQFARSYLRYVQRYEDITPDMLRYEFYLPERARYEHETAGQILIAHQQERTTSSPKQPSRLQEGIQGVGQFFALIWTFIVVKKWKICPIIQLPDESVR